MQSGSTELHSLTPVKLGIARLEADALLGLARVQLGLGDATAARAHAIDALKLANENLLVLRQIKALVVIGEAAAQLGDLEVGIGAAWSTPARLRPTANFDWPNMTRKRFLLNCALQGIGELQSSSNSTV